MRTSDLIASAAVCDKARFPASLVVMEAGLVLRMFGPNGSGVEQSKVIPWDEIDAVTFPPCALVAVAVTDMEDDVGKAVRKAREPVEMSTADKVAEAHRAVTDFKRGRPGALELILDAAMLHFLMVNGQAGIAELQERVHKAAGACGAARPTRAKPRAVN